MGVEGLPHPKSPSASLIFYCHGWRGRIVSFHAANSLLWPGTLALTPYRLLRDLAPTVILCIIHLPLHLFFPHFPPAYGIYSDLFHSETIFLALHSRDHPTLVAPNMKRFSENSLHELPPDHNLLPCYLLLPLYFVANPATTCRSQAARLQYSGSCHSLPTWHSGLAVFLKHSPLLSFAAALLWFPSVYSLLPIRHFLDTRLTLSEHLYSYDFNWALADCFFKRSESKHFQFVGQKANQSYYVGTYINI